MSRNDGRNFEMKTMGFAGEKFIMADVVADVVRRTEKQAKARNISVGVSGDMDEIVMIFDNMDDVMRAFEKAVSIGIRGAVTGGGVELEVALSNYIRFVVRCTGYCDSRDFCELAGLVQELNGSICVESRDWYGTGIHISFPC